MVGWPVWITGNDVQDAFCRLAIAEPPPIGRRTWLYRVAHNIGNKRRTSDSRRQRRERSAGNAQVSSKPTCPGRIEQAEAWRLSGD